MDWLRWYTGTASDPKFRVVARKSGQSVAAVIGVWAMLLERASASPDRGSVRGFDCEAADVTLDLDDGVADLIVDAMRAKGLIVSGRIAKWESRQPKREDNSSDRVKEHRERKRQEKQWLADSVTQCNAHETHGNARLEEIREDLTSPLPPPAGERPTSAAPASDDEAQAQEAESEEAGGGGYLDTGDMGFHELWDAYPKKIKRGAALRAYEATKRRRPNVQALLPVLALQADSPDWRKDKGRYIPTLESWLLDERWREVPGQQAKPQPSIQAESPDQFRARIKRERETVAQSMPRPVAAAP